MTDPMPLHLLALTYPHSHPHTLSPTALTLSSLCPLPHQLTYLHKWTPSLRQALRQGHLTHVSHIALTSTPLDPDKFMDLLAGLGQVPNLRSLALVENHLGDAGVVPLAQVRVIIRQKWLAGSMANAC